MRALFWVLLIAALAVAVTLAARYNAGYVLLVVHPYRVELSLSFLVARLTDTNVPLAANLSSRPARPSPRAPRPGTAPQRWCPILLCARPRG